MGNLVAARGYGACAAGPAATYTGNLLVAPRGYGNHALVPAPLDFGGGGTGSFALYKPTAPELVSATGLRFPEWTFDPNLGVEPIVRERVIPSATLKPTGQLLQTSAPPAPPPLEVDQARWLDFSKLAQVPTGPAINEYVPLPPIIVAQGRDVVVPPTKAPGLQSGPELPAPPPVVTPQHSQAQLDAIPQKHAGPPLIDATPRRATVRENTAWMAGAMLDTTALPRGTNPDAPPAIVSAPGAGPDLFQTRRLAPAPPAEPARRTVSPYLQDQAASVSQHVYAWAQDVLRWEAARHRLGSRSPLPPPGALVIPDEYAWAISTRDRLSLDQARAQANLVAQRELERLIQGTDQPPVAWQAALRDVQRDGPAPPGAGLLHRVLHFLRRRPRREAPTPALQLSAITMPRVAPPPLPVGRMRSMPQAGADWMAQAMRDTRPPAPPPLPPEPDPITVRKIATPPRPDPARRAVSPYLADQAANLSQHVYAWALGALQGQPGRLVIPQEYAWNLATRERLSLPQARARMNVIVQRELARLIDTTDQPPAAWTDALREAQGRTSGLRGLLHRLGR